MSADPDEALIRIDVRFRDLDAFGHVYHAEYLTILDEARTRWFGGRLRLDKPGEYVVARVEIDYLSPAVLSDAPLGASFELHRVGTSSLTTVEELRARDGRELVRTRTVVVLFDVAEGCSRPITTAERARCQALLSRPEDERVHDTQ